MGLVDDHEVPGHGPDGVCLRIVVAGIRDAGLLPSAEGPGVEDVAEMKNF